MYGVGRLRHTAPDMEPRSAKRPRTEGELRRPLRLSETVQEAIFWSRALHGQHPSALLPPPAGLEQLDKRGHRGASTVPSVPPSVARVLDRWIKTNPIYSTSELDRNGGDLDEKSRLDLVKAFLANVPARMRDAPIVPELATASFDSHMLTLGRRYGTSPEGEVPACCNGQSCAALKIKRAFGTPLQRYYTPSEDLQLQRDPSMVAAFGDGPCLICLRHDVETLVRCNAGRCVNPQHAFGQPYMVMLRIYNSVNVPGGYRSDTFSCTPLTAPDVSPVPLVASRTEEIAWQYDNKNQSWYVDQSPLIFNPGSDF